MKRVALMVVAVLGACAPWTDPDQKPAKRWATEDLVRGNDAGAPFGGFLTTRLVTIEADGGATLKVLPAFEDGQPAALVITDLWENHPDPWVQPVYKWVAKPEAPTTLGVGTGTGFYSPFWKLQWVTPKEPLEAPDAGSRDVDQLLKIGEPKEGPLVLCPIVPTGLRPPTGLADKEVKLGTGWAKGEQVAYFDFGWDRFTAPDEGTPDEARLFAFTRTDGGLWELPMVLPSGSRSRSFTRRFDIALQPSWAVYVPAGELQAELAATGVSTVPTQVDGGFDPTGFEGRVAINARCFDRGFPEQCQWLDSEAAIDALVPAHLVSDSHVTASSPSVRLK